MEFIFKNGIVLAFTSAVFSQDEKNRPRNNRKAMLGTRNEIKIAVPGQLPSGVKYQSCHLNNHNLIYFEIILCSLVYARNSYLLLTYMSCSQITMNRPSSKCHSAYHLLLVFFHKVVPSSHNGSNSALKTIVVGRLVKSPSFSTRPDGTLSVPKLLKI